MVLGDESTVAEMYAYSVCAMYLLSCVLVYRVGVTVRFEKGWKLWLWRRYCADVESIYRILCVSCMFCKDMQWQEAQ